MKPYIRGIILISVALVISAWFVYKGDTFGPYYGSNLSEQSDLMGDKNRPSSIFTEVENNFGRAREPEAESIQTETGKTAKPTLKNSFRVLSSSGSAVRRLRAQLSIRELIQILSIRPRIR